MKPGRTTSVRFLEETLQMVAWLKASLRPSEFLWPSMQDLSLSQVVNHCIKVVYELHQEDAVKPIAKKLDKTKHKRRNENQDEVKS